MATMHPVEIADSKYTTVMRRLKIGETSNQLHGIPVSVKPTILNYSGLYGFGLVSLVRTLAVLLAACRQFQMSGPQSTEQQC